MPPSAACARGVAGALVAAACASGFAGTLLLPVSLLSLVSLWGHEDGGHLCCLQDHLGHGHHCCSGGRGKMEGGSGISSTYTTFGVTGLLSSAAAGGVGCGVTWLEGPGFGPCHCCCSLPCGHGHGCSQEAGSCVLPPLLLLGSLGCGTQSLQQGSQDRRHWFHSSPGSASFMCSSPPTFRDADVQIFPGSWCVGQGKALLSYICFRWKGRDKESVSCHHDADITRRFFQNHFKYKSN